jgi:FtsH-binding integral membrane protein
MSYTVATIYPTASDINTAMSRVYLNMAMAVMTSLIISALVASSPGAMAFLHTGIVKWVVIFAPLAAVFGFTVLLNSNPPRSVAQLALHGFAALMGLSMSTIFVVYTGASIASAFFGAMILFLTMTAYGYFTKQSLDSWGKYLFVALIAIIIASIVNLFIGATVVQTVISAIAIVVFLGLTAYDTQKIREHLMSDTSPSVEIMGALTLYMDFINLFLNLLQLFGNKND